MFWNTTWLAPVMLTTALWGASRSWDERMVALPPVPQKSPSQTIG